MTLALGVIADDITGGTDVAVTLRRAGMRTLIFFGQPPADADVQPSDAIVVALKTRMIDSAEAVRQSLAALDWLRDQGAVRHYFKYCSTFDSTPNGNIGPVLDALSEALDESTVVTTPSSPEHGRTQYQGHLFVGPLLLSESPMRDHPLTPMRDSSLPNLLAAQSRRPVGLIPLQTVRAGADAVRDALSRSSEGYLLVDAIDDVDLATIAVAARDARLTAGAAGLAGGLAAALGSAGRRLAEQPQNADPADTAQEDRAPSRGRAAVLSGSCSARTLEQVDRFRAERPAYRLDALAQPDPDALAEAALRWYDSLSTDAAPLIYSSLEPQQLKQVQDQLGVARSAEILETSIGRIAQGLVERGVTRVVAAGGETSGSIVTALEVDGGLIGAEEAPGVPWIHTASGLDLLLKSGNFGEPDLLLEASA